MFEDRLCSFYLAFLATCKHDLLVSHYITVPLNENGIITDQYIDNELKVACSRRFGITDVFLYSHGWWTSAVEAMADYNRFSVNFADKTLEIAAVEPPPLPRLALACIGPR